MSAELKEIFRHLDRLPPTYSLTRRRNIAKRGLKPFIKRTQNLAPKDTGDLILSIDTKIFRDNKKDVFAGITFKRKFKISKGNYIEVDGYYARWIEFGFRHIAWPKKGDNIESNGKNTGKVSPFRIQHIPPRPFVRPAWAQSKNEVKAETERQARKAWKSYERKLKKA